MAGSSADDYHQPPLREGRREIEEGEVVSGTGSDTDTDDEDARYYLQSRHDHDRWANGSAGSARPANSPARSLGSDWTVSDAGAVTVARVGDVVLPARFPCGVCGREFSSSKAVHGHMKVHAQAAKVAAVVVSGGQAPDVEEVGDNVSVSTATVVAADPITPVQSACTNDPVVNSGSGGSSARSSVEPTPTGPQSVANVVAAPPAAAPEQVPAVAPPPVPPQQAPAPAPAAPQQQATVAPVPAATPPQHLPPLQPVFDGPLHIAVRSDPSTSQQRLPPAGNSQRGFSCRECNRWFPTHQGLGGHVAGHKNRRIAAAAAAAAAAGIDPEEHMACRGGARPVRSHACKVCGEVYDSGVSLGGHMRKHYSGKPIVPRKRLRILPELALAPPVQGAAPPAVEGPIVAQPLASYVPAAPVGEAAAQPAPAPLPAGTVRLFGVTIVQAQQAKEEEEHRVDEPMNEQ